MYYDPSGFDINILNHGSYTGGYNTAGESATNDHANDRNPRPKDRLDYYSANHDRDIITHGTAVADVIFYQNNIKEGPKGLLPAVSPLLYHQTTNVLRAVLFGKPNTDALQLIKPIYK